MQLCKILDLQILYSQKNVFALIHHILLWSFSNGSNQISHQVPSGLLKIMASIIYILCASKCVKGPFIYFSCYLFIFLKEYHRSLPQLGRQAMSYQRQGVVKQSREAMELHVISWTQKHTFSDVYKVVLQQNTFKMSLKADLILHKLECTFSHRCD